MQQIVRVTKAKFFRYALMAVLLLSIVKVQAQCGYAPLKQTLIDSNTINIGNGLFRGLVEHLPADYSSNPTKRYPLIIFFHGLGGIGDGSASGANGLCKVFTDQNNSLPNRIERNEFPTTVTVNSETFSYIVISPQFSRYESPYHYGDETNELIDYLIANYRIDTTRMYLTGLSAGANFVFDYISTDVNYASRIAAVSVASLCQSIAISAAGVNGPANIANGGVATWLMHCRVDSNYNCFVSIPDDWVTGINSNSPAISPRYSRMDPNPGFFGDAALPYCAGWSHDTWTALYNQNFAPLDAGPNFYEWQLQFQTTPVTLPVTLKNFTARFSNGKVYLNWITASEKDNASFTIERAGVDQQYKALTTLAGSGNSSHEIAYSFVDDQPLKGLGFYRLLQTDADGKKKYFETKKVMNSTGPRQLIIASPNPFTTTLTAYITVDKKQKVEVWLTDMSGRRVVAVNNLYEEGTTAISIPATHLPKGVYVLKATGENISETYKIIKQQ